MARWMLGLMLIGMMVGCGGPNSYRLSTYNPACKGYHGPAYTGKNIKARAVVTFDITQSTKERLVLEKGQKVYLYSITVDGLPMEPSSIEIEVID